MSVAKRRRGKSSRGRIVPNANPSWCGRIDHWAYHPGGESSRGRIVQRLGETSMGRNVQWAKRPVTDCYEQLSLLHVVQ